MMRLREQHLQFSLDFPSHLNLQCTVQSSHGTVQSSHGTVQSNHGTVQSNHALYNPIVRGSVHRCKLLCRRLDPCRRCELIESRRTPHCHRHARTISSSRRSVYLRPSCCPLRGRPRRSGLRRFPRSNTECLASCPLGAQARCHWQPTLPVQLLEVAR